MCYESYEVFKIYFLKGDSLMIHKKLLCSFVFMSFLFSHGNVVAMYKKSVKVKNNVLANQVPFDTAITSLMSQLQDTNFSLTLGGDNMQQPMQDQWERFINNRAREIDFNNVSNSLNALYPDFIKKIMLRPKNQERFAAGLKNSNINNVYVQNMSLSGFLNADQVKAAFMASGANIVKNMQSNSGNLNTLPTNNPSPIPTPPPAPRLDEAQIVVELTKPNLDQQSPKAVLAADKFLEVDEDEVMTRDDIERLFEEKMEKIQSDFANMPQQQSKMMEAAEVAQEILMNQVEEGNENEPTSEPKNPVSDEFRQKVVNGGMIIAQSLFNDNIFVVTERKINQVMEESDNSKIRALRRMLSESNTDQEMAYLIGYVQSCILQIQQSSSKNISGDAVQVISRIADTLRALNMQQARA